MSRMSFFHQIQMMLARQARVSGRARDVCRNMSTSAAKYLDILARLARVSGRARDVSRNMSSAATDQGTVALDQQEIYSLTEKVLVAAGASREHASAVAEVVMQAERDGSVSHGLFRVPGYVAALKSGKVRGNAQPRLKITTPSLLHCDGDCSFAPLAHRVSLGALETAAKKNGIAALSITRTAHWAALWPETEWLASRGLVGVACCSFLPTVAPHGSRSPLFGTNPMSFAWPRKEGESGGDEAAPAPAPPPLVFDMATAAMALGDVQLLAAAGSQVPLGTGLDRNGEETREAWRIVDGGMLLPFGSYKGSNISMAIELLAGPLLGETTSFETKQKDDRQGPPLGGQLVVALSPDLFSLSSDWARGAEDFIARLSAIDGVRLPGERRHRARRDKGPRRVRHQLLQDIRALL